MHTSRIKHFLSFLQFHWNISSIDFHEIKPKKKKKRERKKIHSVTHSRSTRTIVNAENCICLCSLSLSRRTTKFRTIYRARYKFISVAAQSNPGIENVDSSNFRVCQLSAPVKLPSLYNPSNDVRLVNPIAIRRCM